MTSKIEGILRTPAAGALRSAPRAHQGEGRPRLSVFRSSKHIYAQVIDDARAARWPRPRPSTRRCAAAKTGADKEAAEAVGKLLAERAKAAGVTAVVFDRGGYLFHGRVKALADAAREGGLDF